MFEKFVFIAVFIPFCNGFTFESLKSTFGSEICIPGSMSAINLKTTQNLVLKEAEKDFTSTLINTTSLQNNKNADDKSVLQKIHELVQHNEIGYLYKLEKEEGAAHEKTFTISLKLGDEVYVGEGKSYKKAQRMAASLALENTKYLHPPVKETPDVTTLTPTVLLNNLCMKLGLPVKYSQVNSGKEVARLNTIVDERSKKSYLQKLNESIYMDKDLRVKKDVAQSKGPFKMKVQVGEETFYGVSHTIQSAKHQAASNALDFLIQNKDNIESKCLQEENSQECKKAKASIKSPISLAYEAAQARKLEIKFEIIEESGPAHKKTFVTECTLGALTTIGEGKSKKASKRAAAESMLERLPELPPISQEMQVMSMMKDKKKKKKKNKKNKVIKTKFEELGVVVDNLVDSVMSFGRKSDGKQDSDDSKKMEKPKYLKKSQQDQILELTNFLNVEVQFSDFEENDQFYSILSVLIDPEHICLGSGSDGNTAREKASHGALDLLYSMGLYDRFDNDESSLVMETKETVRLILDHDAVEDS